PFMNFGTPLFSEPESFLSHPAYALVAPRLGIRAGLHALYGLHCFVLLLGLAWLGRRLQLPTALSMATGLFLLCSDEWWSRLGAGHPMILGLCVWPAVIAATLASMDPRPCRLERRLWLGGVAGALLGLAGLVGAHYPVAFGLLLVVFLAWSSAAPVGLQAGLVGVVCIPLVIRDGPEVGRFALDIVGWALIVFGLIRGQRARQQIASIVGTGLGLLASAGFFLIPAARRAADMGRNQLKLFNPPMREPRPLSELVQGSGELESYLSFPDPGIWLLMLLGIILVARRSAALATSSALMLALGWSLGLPLRPWELVSAVPGMSAADFQMRLQWIVLIVSPLGLALGATWVLRRTAGPKAAPLLTLSIAIACVAYGMPRYQLPGETPPGLEPITRHAHIQSNLPATHGVVRGWDAEWAKSGEVYARSSLQGQVIPVEYGDGDVYRELAIPEVAGDGLAWVSRDGSFAAAPAGTEVRGSLATWTVRSPPGTVLALAQRDFDGWHCDGGELSPDRQYLQAERDAGLFDREAHEGMWWLTVAVGPGGEATCRWETPERVRGLLLQLLALIALLLPAARLWRLGRRQPQP
ncbi:MAG TPA: hypothetical protein DIU15_01360, partial [Deltaproteobacteria bacterium]|nr:hypothetical protein [Deltaproteobacteria bacterium]